RQLPVDDVRAPDAVPRSRQLPLRLVSPVRAAQPEPHRRSRPRRLARAAATGLRRAEAARAGPRDPALPGEAAVLRGGSLRRLRRGLGRSPPELRPERRLSLWGEGQRPAVTPAGH